MSRPLDGRVVLVTGGGVRLGRALAEAMGAAGAKVAVHYHASARPAAEVVANLHKEGTEAEAFGADLSDPAQPAALVERVEKALGPLHALINSAALFERADLAATSLESLQRLWDVNARGPYLLSQAAARGMASRSKGHIINILDIGGVFTPWAHYSAYCMSKAAAAMMTRCLALELAPHIRVNGIAPGTVLPPEEMSAEVLEALKSRIPQRRFGSPQDIVDTALFLLTGPHFITGQILAVDGGRSLGNPQL